MKAQITSTNKIHKEFPSGTPCYLTRITSEPQPSRGGRIYTTITYESQKQEYQTIILDENDEPVLDENQEPTYETKFKTIIGKQIHKSEELITVNEVNQLSDLLSPNVPSGLTAWDSEIYKIALALQYKTINDAVLDGSFMGVGDWELDLEE